MTEVAEVTTIGEVERRVHGSGMWDGTGPVEFSDNGLVWSEAWSPVVEQNHLPDAPVQSVVIHGHPEFARVTVYRKGVRIPTTVTIRWDEQRPRENEEWAAKWDAAPTRHFGRTARMVAFRQTFRDILGDVSIEDEERTTRPTPETQAPVEDWAALIEAAEDLENLDAIDKAARAVKAFTPDKAGTDLHRQLRAKRKALTEAAWEPKGAGSLGSGHSPSVETVNEREDSVGSVEDTSTHLIHEPAPRPATLDHLPGNRATRRAQKRKTGKRGRR
ncbi:hypothetical protein P2P98_08575 [Microbacterium sp. Kw_RZR3]|uniref:hypothetical protein n=1 Tax=Microbacterium sp. Kw_RZR3 TaxID=3032903 RepID=UPI0023DAD4B8|nr:hypothetical protein [Microbacterium sp. Kw_RZR3]MDF2046211.1 hypothetical protein [Microbacterium sp. Kw_RZR3]